MRVKSKRVATIAATLLGVGVLALACGAPPAVVASAPVAGGISPGSAFESRFATMTATEQQSVISLMTSDHVHWLRLDEPGNEAFAQRAEASGIEVDAVIKGSTSSSSSLAGTCTHVARSLKPDGVQTYEVLNEINRQISAEAYVPLLKTCYNAIKSSDPASTVLSSGLSDATGNEAPVMYLRAMYAAGAKSYFDAVAVHPYSFGWVNVANESAPMYPASWNTFYELPTVYQVMKDNGDGSKKIWLTEYGCPTGTEGGYQNPHGRAWCTDASLATDITQAYNQANTWSWIGNLFIYNWQDASSGGDGDFGLYYSNGSPKPDSLAAFKSAV